MPDADIQTPPGSKVNPLDNLGDWLEQNQPKRDAEPAAEPDPAAQTPEPATAQPAYDWREVVLGDDVDHGFFKGKKVTDVVESYKHAERRMQEANTRAAELQRELERERAVSAARTVAAEQKAPATREQKVDPRIAEMNDVWFSDPERAQQLMNEMSAERAEAIANQTFERRLTERDATTRQQGLMRAGYEAWEQARTQLNVPDVTWSDPDRSIALLAALTNPNGRYVQNGGPTNVANIIDAHERLFGRYDAAPVPVAAMPAPAPTPPGSRRPAAAVIPGTTSAAISEEQRAAWTRLAEASGVPPEVFIKRMSGGARA